jgi:phage terminase small subunit
MANLKIVDGNGEIKKVNKNLYQILDKLPAPNSKFSLSKDAKYWYDYFGQQLVDTQKLTKPDLIHLVQLATAVDYYIQNENEILKRGYIGGVVQIFKGGASNISGFISARKSFIAEINGLSKHFGFSFADRSKLNENKETNTGQVDMFEEFKNAKHG